MKTILKIVLALAAVLVLAVVGGYFALKRPDIPYEQLEAKYQQADDRYVDLPSGVRAHYRIDGKADGPTILLIHGFGVDLDAWSQWVRELGGDYRLISVDLPGHGLTRAPDDYKPTISAFADFVEEFASATGLSNFALAGNSMGGNTAWLFTLRHPERVNSLILVAAAGWVPPNAKLPLPLQLFLDPRFQPYLVRIDYTWLMSMLKMSYANPERLSDSTITRYAELARAPGHRLLIARMIDRGPDANATKEKLAAIRAPTLILWGEDDKLVPPADAQKYADAIPGSVVKMYANVGHMPQQEAAAQSAADVKAFLNERTLAGAALADVRPPMK
jgi:pimeloyl-ACP methyl ester carboxylesterase